MFEIPHCEVVHVCMFVIQIVGPFRISNLPFFAILQAFEESELPSSSLSVLDLHTVPDALQNVFEYGLPLEAGRIVVCDMLEKLMPRKNYWLVYVMSYLQSLPAEPMKELPDLGRFNTCENLRLAIQELAAVEVRLRSDTWPRGSERSLDCDWRLAFDKGLVRITGGFAKVSSIPGVGPQILPAPYGQVLVDNARKFQIELFLGVDAATGNRLTRRVVLADLEQLARFRLCSKHGLVGPPSGNTFQNQVSRIPPFVLTLRPTRECLLFGFERLRRFFSTRRKPVGPRGSSSSISPKFRISWRRP